MPDPAFPSLATDSLRLPADTAQLRADTAAVADSLPRYLLRPDEVAPRAEWGGLRPVELDSLLQRAQPAAAPDTVELPLFRLEQLHVTEVPGFTGDPLPYSFRTDNYVTAALLLAFLLTVWVLAVMRRYLHECVKDFFHRPARAEALDERTGSERRAQWLQVCLTCFLLSILYFDFVQHHNPRIVDETSPYLILATGTGLCWLYYVAKHVLYQTVNFTLFDRQRAQLWNETYQLSVLALGLLLLPLTLWAVYFDVSYENLLIAFICLVLVVKIPLLFQCSGIFFNGLRGCFHLILYFCALELAPALVLWRVLLRATFYLTSNP